MDVGFELRKESLVERVKSGLHLNFTRKLGKKLPRCGRMGVAYNLPKVGYKIYDPLCSFGKGLSELHVKRVDERGYLVDVNGDMVRTSLVFVKPGKSC